jgi:uncharacterized protein (TIGR00730 family)
MRSIGLFCSSSDGLPPATRALAQDFGTACGERGIRLVYGGGARGLMGIAARAAHAAGGEVRGIMLEALARREGANVAIGELRFVSTLAERKHLIAAESEAFVALPGGIGTLDELTEILTLDDIGLAGKPVCLTDADGFWDPFFGMLERFTAYGVMRAAAAGDLLRARTAVEALDVCAAAVAAAGARAGPAGRAAA